MNNKNKFLVIMTILATAICGFSLFLNYIFTRDNINTINLLLALFNTIILVLLGIIIFSIGSSYAILSNKKVSKNIMKINFKIISTFYPFIIYLSKLFRIPKNDIRNVYVHLNNEYIYSNKYKISPKDIMILTPHCIQKSFCKHKITNDINNCVRCQKCNVSDLLDIKEEYGVNVFVASGGTLARKIIKENKPKAIIAVACERDLTSGIQDVESIPVVGVFNKRPHGPCINTEIDTMKIKKAIEFFEGGV
ncbi:DUF116 domain-containing protein [Alkalithermobacter paradoxus]|uniref:DUF116 domain-containing protein n=1 Tax=Alkalithermobacter paradoxus TaxID=29349 RepID=A0A1V4IBJ1_9FIRM|nr:hypothetical protein CLOTH_01890 [[Clostridium] thermoalcaliphilum]